MTNDNITMQHRVLSAQISEEGTEIAMKTVLGDMKRRPSIHIFPELGPTGHVGTHIDLVFHGWEALAAEENPEAIIQSFVLDLAGDLQGLIAGGLAETAAAYVKAAVSGEDWVPKVRNIEQDAEGSFTITDSEKTFEDVAEGGV